MAQMRRIFYRRRKLAILLTGADRHNIAAGDAPWAALAARLRVGFFVMSALVAGLVFLASVKTWMAPQLGLARVAQD